MLERDPRTNNPFACYHCGTSQIAICEVLLQRAASVAPTLRVGLRDRPGSLRQTATTCCRGHRITMVDEIYPVQQLAGPRCCAANMRSIKA